VEPFAFGGKERGSVDARRLETLNIARGFNRRPLLPLCRYLRYLGGMTKVMEERFAEIERRVEVLERRQRAVVADEKSEATPLNGQKFAWKNPNNAWLDGLYGRFKDDPDFEDAVRLGREYRERQPKC
jgi:hypothetical protein